MSNHLRSPGQCWSKGALQHLYHFCRWVDALHSYKVRAGGQAAAKSRSKELRSFGSSNSCHAGIVAGFQEVSTGSQTQQAADIICLLRLRAVRTRRIGWAGGRPVRPAVPVLEQLHRWGRQAVGCCFHTGSRCRLQKGWAISKLQHEHSEPGQDMLSRTTCCCAGCVPIAKILLTSQFASCTLHQASWRTVLQARGECQASW